ncbi:serine-rich adhesin for platelets [Colias croceus]|uniref:serine-rich adhesin for platelets n=1 Tax=Colias crocea TaxID=72248 RepID=UPI001E27BD6B|nr:serine-rich adhesin for platelets [Colias croceus]
MREFIRIILLCLCAFLLSVREVTSEESTGFGEVSVSEGKAEEQGERKDVKSNLPGSVRRSTTQSSSNTTRNSQLLSVLAARRRQLLTGRLASHINTLATIANKPHKTNTTFAQLEIRDSNNSVVKRITFDNSSNEAIAPTLKLITNDGVKETRQDIKPHEIRHLFIPRIYQDNKNRAGFLNNRRFNKTNAADTKTESSIIYVPPEKGEELDKGIELDPEEEFQVDESNHGLYLLNYSDTDNVTQSPPVAPNKTTSSNEIKENATLITEAISVTTEKAVETTPKVEEQEKEKVEVNTIANSTDVQNTKLIKVEHEKDKTNQTLFMSQEIYNHFRPLETELPDEEMAPFIYFGQKLGGPVINDNLTNSPSLSASTKAANFIVAPSEKRKFNSRYSATEKYRNTSAGEDEINEDMDVSVVKNVIEKNKIRNTVKGPAPARHVGLVNAYRKYPSTTQKPLNIGQLNVTEPIVQNVTPSIQNKTKDVLSNTTVNPVENVNGTAIKDNLNKTTTPPTSSTPPLIRNFTRNYFNLRRRPSKITTLLSTESSLNAPVVNTTTEKASTSVYTAVVTSVSITSSVRGQNKTDPITNESDNSTSEITSGNIQDKSNVTDEIIIYFNDTETTAIPTTTTTTTLKPYRHRIRIRTTTTENPFHNTTKTTQAPITYKPIESPLTSEKYNGDLSVETITSKISERLASLFRQNDYDNATNGITIRPKNILKRRRPTTTSTTTTTTTSTIKPTVSTREESTTLLPTTTAQETTTQRNEVTESILKTLIVTSRSASSSSTTLQLTNMTQVENDTVLNLTRVKNESDTQNEVVIEAEKTYTASYVLAGLGFLPVIAVVGFVLRNLLNKKTKEIDTEYEGYFDDGSDIKKESPITPVARPPIPPPTKPDQKWEFPRNKLRLQTLLGQGNFGQVWKAEADDLNGHDGLTRLVAVKTIKESASQKEKQELLHEIYIMQKIGTHPNVVTLLACCTEQEPYLLIMEYVMCGKLLTYLRERRSRPDRFSGGGSVTSRDLTVFAYCVARGMDYIASKGIVHRDLAARNVLVDHNKLCKIADFGMSRCAGAAARAARGALPVRWMAPEALLYNVYSHHSDVWAFGILLWEIVTLGSTPYAAMSGREVLTAVTEGYRLERPPHCKPQLYRAMHACWHADPNQRPTFAQLKSQLAELLDNEPVEGNYVDLDSFYQESSVYSDPSAIINDEEGLSAEYDRERRVFRELKTGQGKFENRAFNLRDEEMRNKFGIGTPRMGGFGIRDLNFERNFSDGEFADRSFTDKNFADRNFADKNFADKNFTDRNFTDKNFNDPNFVERKDGKLSTSSFHRDRERENPLVSRNSFNGFPRINANNHFQMTPDGRNKRVSEFECDI